MGALKINTPEGERTLPLLPSTLLGRGPRCHGVIEDPRVPMYWLEIRWFVDDGWCWRVLSGEGSTRGTGAPAQGGWRRYGQAMNGSGKVAWDGDIVVQLFDPSPPDIVVEDLHEERLLQGAACDDLLERTREGARPIDWEDRGSPAMVVHRQVLEVAGRTVRVHLPEICHVTDRAEILITSDDCELELDLSRLRATLTTRHGECVVRHEPVRTLAVYAIARDEHADEGGWLTRDEAFERWVALGGNPDSPSDRLGWDRGKVRTQLVRQGASGVEGLFELVRTRGVARTRLSLAPEQMTVKVSGSSA